MTIVKKRKIINVRKDGTEFSSEEWAEYWKNHTVPLNDDTRGYYQTLAGIIKVEMQKNTTTVDPEEVAVSGVAMKE